MGQKGGHLAQDGNPFGKWDGGCPRDDRESHSSGHGLWNFIADNQI